MSRSLLAPAVLAGLLAAGPAPAVEDAPASGKTAAQIDACVRENLPEDSTVVTLVMRAHDRVGAVTEMRSQVQWQRLEDGLSRVLMCFSDPPDLRGAALLMIEKEEQNDMFMYLPELRRVRRVSGSMMSGSMFGTDFSYEEFQHLQGLEEEHFESRRLADAEVGGRPVWVVETVPGENVETRPGFERMLTYVEQERCVPLRAEFFDRGGKASKRMIADLASVEARDGRHLARQLEMEDLQDGTKTVLEVEAIEIDPEIRSSQFSASALERRPCRNF